MKKMYVLLLAVLFSTAVFAGGTFENPGAAKSVAVMKKGESVFNLIYKGTVSCNVKVAIYDAKNKLVFAETVKKKDGFARPYNFDGLAEGDYTIEVSDLNGTHVEKISYRKPHDELIQVVKLAGADDRYLLTVAGNGDDKISINIFDENLDLVHHEIKSINKDFGQIYNLKNLKGRITFEVTGDRGSKTIRY